MNQNHPARVVVVGEILFDLINGQKHLGGAPFNFAYHLMHLGFSVRFISRVGNDANGKEILNKLKRFQFPVADIQSDPVLDTGTVHVEIDSTGSPRFEITAPVAYDHIEFMEKIHLPILNSAACLYFGSLVLKKPQRPFSYSAIFAKHPVTKNMLL